jgi:hypothetical protein
MPRPSKDQIAEREALAAQGLKRCNACGSADAMTGRSE